MSKLRCLLMVDGFSLVRDFPALPRREDILWIVPTDVEYFNTRDFDRGKVKVPRTGRWRVSEIIWRRWEHDGGDYIPEVYLVRRNEDNKDQAA